MTKAGIENSTLEKVRPDTNVCKPKFLRWFVVYLIFVILPIIIIALSIYKYFEDSFEEQKDKIIQYHYRELLSIRKNLTSNKVFEFIISSYLQENAKKLASESLNSCFEKLMPNLPRYTTLVAIRFYNKHNTEAFIEGNFKNELTKLETHLRNPELYSLVELATATLNVKDDFMRKANNLLGLKIPWFALVSNVGKVIEFHDEPSYCFYYNEFNTYSGSIIRLFSIIPKHLLNDEFALNFLINYSDKACYNPEYTLGYFTLDNPPKIFTGYKELSNTAKYFVNQYKYYLKNIIYSDDYVFVNVPYSVNLSNRIFALFSVRSINEKKISTLLFYLYFIVIAIVLSFIIFLSLYKKARELGISIKFKFTSLLVLSTFLPISFIILVSVNFHIDRTKILFYEANQKLQQVINEYDENFIEYLNLQRSIVSNFISSIKKMSIEQGLLETKLENEIPQIPFDYISITQLDGKNLNKLEFSKFQSSNETGLILFRNFANIIDNKIIQSLISSSSVIYNTSTLDSLLENVLSSIIKKHDELQLIEIPGLNIKSYFYYSLFNTEFKTRPQKNYIVKIFLNQEQLEKDYISKYLKNITLIINDFVVYAFKKDNLKETYPEIPINLKMQLVHFIPALQIKNYVEAEKIHTQDGAILFAMANGKNIEKFYLGASMNYNTIFQPLFRMYIILGFIVAASIVVAYALGIIISKGLIQPVTNLAIATNLVGKGDIAKVVVTQVVSYDEIGKLSLAFNDMIMMLKRRYEEHNVLYSIAKVASTSNNLKEVFELTSKNLANYLKSNEYGFTLSVDNDQLAQNFIFTNNLTIISNLTTKMNQFRSEGLVRKKIHFEIFKDLNAYKALILPINIEEELFGVIYTFFDSKSQIYNLSCLKPEEINFIETLRTQLALICEKKKILEEAITDGLTGLYIRKFFLASLGKEINRALRYRYDLCLILIDIDHFKKFNDTYGHQAGDYVLKETAQCIHKSIRSVDLAGRYGGEEMAVLLPQTTINNGIIVAERLRSKVEQNLYKYNDINLSVTISVGVSSLAGRNISMEELIEEADSALYKAKNSGRNRVVAKLLINDDQFQENNT